EHRRLAARELDRLVDGHIAGDRDTERRARLAEVEDEAARVDPRERDDAVLGEPVRPLRPARLAHEHRARVRGGGLGALGRDAVVADHRRREADELILEARVGRCLLVAGHAGREDGLAERVTLGAYRLALPDRAVCECEVAHSNVTWPPASVMRTAP